MEKKPMDCYQALKFFHILFYGGLVCMLFALMMGQMEYGFLTYLFGVIGMIAAFGGLIFGFLKVRCPDCGKALVVGRAPGIPKFCPNCGKQLREEES